MKWIISGASGLIGSALAASLLEDGHEVARLVRSPGSPGAWDPETGVVDTKALDGADVIAHLAGENIAQGRWSEQRKRRVMDSRVHGTNTIVRAIAGMAKPPKTLLCASAVGFYGDGGDAILDETRAPGKGFLADVCEAWEAASRPAVEYGVRVVNLRFGMVLSARGGALAKMLPLFRLGLGGALGSGRQYMSWIALDDAVAAIRHCAQTPSLEGPVNVVAPEPVANAVFTKTLGQVLRRPAVLPAPAFALKLVLGEMAQELLLSGQRAVPAKLVASGYAFRHATLESALESVLR